MFYTFLWIGLVLQLVRAEGECTPVTSEDPSTCKTCGAMINGKEYCSQCNDAGGTTSAPTDGVCTTDNAVCNPKAEGKCTTCTGNSFMYKDGCYAIAKEPGKSMCGAADAGKCTQAKAGYFLPLDADRDATKQSVMSCGSDEEITAGNAKKYKGVLHCKECRQPDSNAGGAAVPAICTACEDGFFGAACEACHSSCLTCEATGETKCKSCRDGYFLGATGGGQGKCVSCGDTSSEAWKGVDGCLRCTTSGSANTPATCNECQEGRYLKDGGSAGCVLKDACTGTHFPNDNVEGKKKCLPCGDRANGGIENCEECSLLSPVSRSATALIKCSKCGSDKKLSPLGDACLDNCPAGTYTSSSGNICKPCHTSCAECTAYTTGENSCTACYPGFVLSKGDADSTGTCIPECTGKYAENCEATKCTAVVGGSKYCSKCKTGYAPVDGICVSTTTREPTGCTPGNGVCDACTGTYFLQSGGCYNAQTLPGKMLCTAANAGKCQTCAATGQNAAEGKCPECSEGCAKCADSNACTECYSGYYKGAGNKCFKCTSGDNAVNNPITGVADCISCAPPTGGNGGPVTCYVKADGTSGGDDGTGGSTNKSGLSTGAIAGIAVAVVIVVGGLVGFLCWWFICRGKA
ncbi:VSP [Giardia lamblia P15]|uniref:VSP n=1 Tax=Giardia intestinalis (strain P15) TaxID=658858 RepID=E1F4X0_GIAIA|nr:VSP [Giardia lamblia P15]